MASVSNDWYFELRLVREAQILSILRGAEGTLLGLGKLLIIWMLGDDSSIELWLKWIDVEEGVLPVVYLSGWHAIQTLETLISNGWEVHVCTLL